MKAVKKTSGLLLATAAAALLVTGCQTSPEKGDGMKKEAAKTEMSKGNACSGKNGCSGKNSCSGKNACSGKNSCSGKNACSGKNGCSGKNSCPAK